MKRHLYTFLLLAIMLCAFSSAFAQSKLFSQPKRLLLAGDTLKETNENPILLKSYFYPLGWSKDGKFAFYAEPPDEACGCYFAEIYIVDLKTDKILWSKKYNSRQSRIDTLAEYWQQNKREFSRKLNQFGIIQSKDFSLVDPRFKYKNDSYTLELYFDVDLGEDGYSSKGEVKIEMISARRGKKILYQKIYKGENFAGILSSKIGGVLLSPFEARAAVIRTETQRGWEGPPNVTKISVVGADLNKGFNKY